MQISDTFVLMHRTLPHDSLVSLFSTMQVAQKNQRNGHYWVKYGNGSASRRIAPSLWKLGQMLTRTAAVVAVASPPTVQSRCHLEVSVLKRNTEISNLLCALHAFKYGWPKCTLPPQLGQPISFFA